MKKIISNRALAPLSQLSHKVRKLIGPVKVNQMVADDQYLFTVLIQAALSDDDALILLVSKVSENLGVEKYLIKANETGTDASNKADLLEDIHKETLMDLWHALQGKTLTLSASDNEKLNRYVDAMHTVKLAEREVEVRSKIAKLILIEQRQHALTSDSYRENIKKIINLISSARLQDYVLDVAREFHHFCLNT